jgi:hypothetical protein
MKYLKITLLLFLCIMQSCTVSNQQSSSTGGQKSSENKDNKAKLIFINFIITKDSAQDHSTIDITQVKITDGSIKKKNLPDIYQHAYQNELKCVIEDNNEKKIHETIVEHPLIRRSEYALEDGNIGIKDIILKKAVFFIRCDYSPQMKYVRVFEKLSSSEEKEIAKLGLKK